MIYMSKWISPKLKSSSFTTEMCQKFYTDKDSPLYRQIKMLGIGSGAISQAFFIEYSREAIKRAGLNIEQLQKCYEQLFYYFRAFQTVFPEDWPVPKQFEDIRKLEEHAAFVLKERRSQLVKTNGFGAILRVFPRLHEVSGVSLRGYLNRIERLREKISSKPQIGEIFGEPRPFKNHLVEKMESILFPGPRLRCDSQNLRFTAHDVCRLQLYGLLGMGPGGLNVGVDGGVDDTAGARLSAREEDEFRLVEDAFGLDVGHFCHFSDPIHRSATGIKIIRIIFCGVTTLRRAEPARPTNDRDIYADAEFAQPDFYDFAVGAFGGQLYISQIQFDADEEAVISHARYGGCATA